QNEDDAAPARRHLSKDSLDVLNLLAELLDLRPQFKPLCSQSHIVRLGRERIGLTAELLGEEIEPPPDGAALVEQSSRGGDMGFEPVKLLANVRLGGDEDRLLMQAVLVEASRGVH